MYHSFPECEYRASGVFRGLLPLFFHVFIVLRLRLLPSGRHIFHVSSLAATNVHALLALLSSVFFSSSYTSDPSSLDCVLRLILVSLLVTSLLILSLLDLLFSLLLFGTLSFLPRVFCSFTWHDPTTSCSVPSSWCQYSVEGNISVSGYVLVFNIGYGQSFCLLTKL